MRKTVLIDADILVYRCGFAAQKTHYQVVTKEGDCWGSFESAREADEFMELNPHASLERVGLVEEHPVGHAIQNLETTLAAIKARYPDWNTMLFLSGETNFRDELAVTKPYKGNREDAAKPIHYSALRSYMTEAHNAITTVGQEADDAIGIAQMQFDENGVICSTDKDLNMIPGKHFNWVTGATYYVTLEAADRAFFLQLLTGDTTDNVPGLPGYGPVKARKELEGLLTYTDLFNKCRKLYSNDKYMLEQGRLLWIRRNEGELWSFPE